MHDVYDLATNTDGVTNCFLHLQSCKCQMTEFFTVNEFSVTVSHFLQAIKATAL